MTSERTEFSLAGRPTFDRRGPVRWIWSHQSRNPVHAVGFVLASVTMVVLNSAMPGQIGRAFDVVLAGGAGAGAALRGIALLLLALVIGRSVLDFAARFCVEVLAKRMERDARDELYVSLLGKSQTFHNRQRVGDLMARGAGDVRQLGTMFSPGIDLLVDSMSQFLVPLVFIALLDPRLLVAPMLFAATFIVSLRWFVRRMQPVSAELREQYGELGAGLNETIRGIEVVKATGQERQEEQRFARNAGRYRAAFVRQGLIQARYLPTLLLSVALAGGLLHGLVLLDAGELTVGGLITYLGLVGLLGFPAFISIFTFSLVQNGIASAERLLELMRTETELDHNATGHAARMRGAIRFEDVTFSYGGEPVLENVSFAVEPGQTLALVGETGSGKSTLTMLINRIYDVDSGRVLVDEIDVRDWNLDSLRSQISTIEQDIVLFSRPVAENIGFSVGQRATREEIVRAAQDAQADGFISELEEGYDTVIGERGVTLSGGQRQRLAIARALLTDPAVLVLDDSTSAIDSATEDQIQRAIQRAGQDRTTVLITHRLSQIRWADAVLLLERGRVVDAGSHEELLGRCDLYRRIFAPHEPRLTDAVEVR